MKQINHDCTDILVFYLFTNISWIKKFLTGEYKLNLILSKKMNGFQGNCCILWGLQKLGIILENKVHPNLKLARHDF